MSRSISTLMVFGATVLAVAGGIAQLAVTPAQSQDAAVTLGDNDGIFVDKATFKVVKGSGAKGDTAAILAKMGAKEVAAGAIVYRFGDKLYIVDATPPPNAPPQFMHDLKSWCPTCDWYIPQTYMK